MSGVGTVSTVSTPGRTPHRVTLPEGHRWLRVADASWVDQCRAGYGQDGSFYAGKRADAMSFLDRELPRTAAMLAILREADGLTLDLDPAVL